jgi:Ca2+-transporting ATPase
MEPAEKDILKQPPRPKKEPIVLGWMWISILMNGVVLSTIIIGIYIFSLNHYVGAIFNDDIDAEDAQIENGLQYARTVAFISLVFCENVRAYTSRSFDKPVWRNLLGNVTMQKAVLMAQAAMLIAVLVPYLSEDILELQGRHIGWFGWLLTLAGPVATLVICELCKLITGCQMRSYQRRIMQQGKDDSVKDAPRVQQLETVSI